MTATPPLPGKTATVTITEIRDEHNNLVGENVITESLTLTVRGTAAPNTALWLRDRVSQFTDVTSGPGGVWTKTFTLTQFKCVVLSAIEKNLPYDFSSARRFTTITTTPITNTVTGDGKPIENGGSYDGASAEFIGNAPPRATLKVIDGTTELSETATVDACGLFKFTLSGLEEKKYEIKFQAPDGKESQVFTFTKGKVVQLSIDDVLTDENISVPEGASTLEKNLTIKGKANTNEGIRIVGGVPTPVTTKANEHGDWEYAFKGLSNRPYSVTAASIDNPSNTSPPRTFSVRAAIQITLANITDADGEVITESSTTSTNVLFVNGKGEKGKKFQVLDDGTALGEGDVKETGDYRYQIGPLSAKSYNLVTKALYAEGGESAPYEFTVATIEEPEITSIYGAGNEVIEDGGKTTSSYLVIRGTAAENAEVQLNGTATNPPPKDQSNDKGVCVFLISGLRPAVYRFTLQGLYGSNPSSKSWTISVLPA